MRWHTLILLLVVIAPLALLILSAYPRLRPYLALLAIAAPLPALFASLWLAPGTLVQLPLLILGTTLGFDAWGRAFLFLFALLWLLAAWHAFFYLRDDPRRVEFSRWMLLAMAGTLATPIAVDPVSFYAAFSVMSLAAYGLIVHDRKAASLRAGRVTIAFVIASELAFFAGLVLGGAGPLASASASPLAVALLCLGLAIKAGIVPVHGWLPLAHPAAPAPASAVLSGAMIAVGLLGALRFLPVPLASAGEIALFLGASSAIIGVALGLRTSDPKSLLAYSSVSQMGLGALGIGLFLLSTDAVEQSLAGMAVVLFAVHHGLAKASLFLGTSLSPGRSTGAGRMLRLAALLLPALALAGAPLTGGLVAKSMLKEVAVEPIWVDLFLSVSSSATTLLLWRFLRIMWARDGAEKAGIHAPIGASVLLTALGFLAWPMLFGTEVFAFGLSSVLAALWPIVLGVLAGLLLERFAPAPAVSPKRPGAEPTIRSFLPVRIFLRGKSGAQNPEQSQAVLHKLRKVGNRLQAVETGAQAWRMGAGASILVGAMLLWLGRA